MRTYLFFLLFSFSFATGVAAQDQQPGVMGKKATKRPVTRLGTSLQGITLAAPILLMDQEKQRSIKQGNPIQNLTKPVAAKQDSTKPGEAKPGAVILKADFDLFYNILKAAHAGLYKYHSKQDIDRMFALHRSQIQENTDLIGFYNHLSTVSAYIGSVHDGIKFPDSIREALSAAPGYFPYPLKIIAGKLLMNIDHEQIPAGAEIISINGLKSKKILLQLYDYSNADGYNTSGKLLDINAKFPWFYRLKFGRQATFKVVYKADFKKEKTTVILPSATYNDYKVLFAKRHSLQLDTILNRRYSFKLIDSLNTGILTINTFSFGNTKNPKHKAYKAFLQNTFRSLREKQIKHLIVDIRKNGGGSDPNDLMTFSYLAHAPYKENAEAFTIFQQVPYPAHFIAEDPEEIKDLEEELREEHHHFSEGRYYQDASFNPFWQPDSLAFKGEVFLLSGPAVASAASLFGSLVKNEGKAIVVGEESIGGYYGHTGHLPVSYKLPYTGIIIRFSTVDLRQYITRKSKIPFGRGILPDIRIRQSQKDFIENKDRVLDDVLKKINH